MSSRIKILGIPIDPLTMDQTLSKIQTNITHNIRTFIATPNPEMILLSLRDSSFKQVLLSTDINVADGIGLLWASTYLDAVKDQKSKFKKIATAFYYLFTIILSPSKIRQIIPQRVTGSDMLKEICKSNPTDSRFFLLGGQPNVNQMTSEILSQKYKLIISGTDSSIIGETTDNSIIDKINKSDANVLFVAFGAPKQEMWIHKNLSHLPNIKLVVGIGGAFDFMSGIIPRAPLFMRNLGLEWLYRLIKQPSRIKRIYNASVKFPLKVISSSF